MKINLKKIKGQFTIIALIMILIAILVFTYTYPPLWDTIEPQITNNITPKHPEVATLLDLTPLFMAIAILVSIIWYIIPERRR